MWVVRPQYLIFRPLRQTCVGVSENPMLRSRTSGWPVGPFATELPRLITMTLRPANAGDAPSAAALLLASRKAFQAYAPLAHSDDEVRRWMRDVLIPSGGVTLACDNHAVVGILAISQDEARIGWIEQLHLLPGHTSRGIGQHLLNHALASLPRPIRLYTFQANTRARAFYERNRYKPIAFSDGSTNEERCPDVLYELL